MRDSVTAAVERFRQLAESGQWDSVGTLYSDATGFRFAESGAFQYGSAADVRAALAQLPPGVRIETTYHDVQVDPVAPGVAVVSALFESTFAGNDGMAFSFSGALTLVWAHEPDGWKIRSGHSSSPVPRR